MERLANLIEGAFWIVIGVGFAVSAIRPRQRSQKILAVVNFLAFGASDFVEAHTGAWWRPPWLLVWKVTCVGVMIAQLIVYMKRRRRGRSY